MSNQYGNSYQLISLMLWVTTIHFWITHKINKLKVPLNTTLSRYTGDVEQKSMQSHQLISSKKCVKHYLHPTPQAEYEVLIHESVWDEVTEYYNIIFVTSCETLYGRLQNHCMKAEHCKISLWLMHVYYIDYNDNEKHWYLQFISRLICLQSLEHETCGIMDL